MGLGLIILTSLMNDSLKYRDTQSRTYEQGDTSTSVVSWKVYNDYIHIYSNGKHIAGFHAPEEVIDENDCE